MARERKQAFVTAVPATQQDRHRRDWKEHSDEFRSAQRFRAGIEGSISFLKRVLGLFRCFSKGWLHFVSTVGMTVVTHNLLKLAAP